MPASRARIPNDTPNAAAAIAIGSTARAPATIDDRVRAAGSSVMMDEASISMDHYSNRMELCPVK